MFLGGFAKMRIAGGWAKGDLLRYTIANVGKTLKRNLMDTIKGIGANSEKLYGNHHVRHAQIYSEA